MSFERKDGARDREESPEDADDLISSMGRERMALRARKTTVALLRIASFVCLGVAGLSLAGYAPYSPGSVVVLCVTGVVGLVLSVLESPHP